MENVLTPLAKIVWTPLAILETVSATDAAIQKKFYGLNTLI